MSGMTSGGGPTTGMAWMTEAHLPLILRLPDQDDAQIEVWTSDLDPAVFQFLLAAVRGSGGSDQIVEDQLVESIAESVDD